MPQPPTPTFRTPTVLRLSEEVDALTTRLEGLRSELTAAEERVSIRDEEYSQTLGRVRLGEADSKAADTPKRALDNATEERRGLAAAVAALETRLAEAKSRLTAAQGKELQAAIVADLRSLRDLFLSMADRVRESMARAEQAEGVGARLIQNCRFLDSLGFGLQMPIPDIGEAILNAPDLRDPGGMLPHVEPVQRAALLFQDVYRVMATTRNGPVLGPLDVSD